MQQGGDVHPPRFGAIIERGGVRFSVWSGQATLVQLCLFDAQDRETGRFDMESDGQGVHSLHVAGLQAGAKYGFRADGAYDPAQGLWFDPDKLLTDPYALAIDRPYVFDPRLAAKRGEGSDTASLMPKSVVVALPQPTSRKPPMFQHGGLIYELQVRGFTKLHPDIPEEQRGTIAALAHPAIIDHLQKLGVSAVELMPVNAWIDERHLPPLGLCNAWGYNPVGYFALDPRLAPGGLAELRQTVTTLHGAGIGVILDVVFNHTGESDVFGPTLSLRGLDNHSYYRSVPGQPGTLVNDTGTGNTLRCDHPVVQTMVLDSMRHFVRHAAIDGFRFDLAPIMGRTDSGFDAHAALLRAITEDAELRDRILIAEPWDIGPDGYQLGRFPPDFLEWNDHYRDDSRRFWRGDRGMIGALATRLAGSSDIFGGSANHTRSVNFIAAHDGMTLADVTAFEHKHNDANGEHNRDGHNENLSWNNGIEGATDDPAILDARRRDAAALLATLFASRGTIMLTAGDEFGRTQRGNNNAYAQDNDITWLDWQNRDRLLEAQSFALGQIRKAAPVLRNAEFLTGRVSADDFADVVWLDDNASPLGESQWHDGNNRLLTMVLAADQGQASRVAIVINGSSTPRHVLLPEARHGFFWQQQFPTPTVAATADQHGLDVASRTVTILFETQDAARH